ncbi:hypothetical protein ACF0H5_008071 [Mactra antiquata]
MGIICLLTQLMDSKRLFQRRFMSKFHYLCVINISTTVVIQERRLLLPEHTFVHGYMEQS